MVRLWGSQITAHVVGAESHFLAIVNLVFLHIYEILAATIDSAAGDGDAARGINTWSLCRNIALGSAFASVDCSAGSWFASSLDLHHQGLVSSRSLEGGVTN